MSADTDSETETQSASFKGRNSTTKPPAASKSTKTADATQGEAVHQADFIRLNDPEVPHSTEKTPPRSSPARSSISIQSETSTPPLPDEVPPPLPDEPPPPIPDKKSEDDGWQPIWDETHQAYYFFNKYTNESTWTNPRLPHGPESAATDRSTTGSTTSTKKALSGYNPAIHGDYDPTADYAQNGIAEEETQASRLLKARAAETDVPNYSATGFFNRFTGKWQSSEIAPENHNDENKSKRQMEAFFDVDSLASSHDGKSLRAERQNRKLSKKELKAFQAKRKEKKEEKRRAWLRD
jgi:hypothetical protein